MIRQTSLDSWVALQPDLAVRQAQVYRCIMEYEPISNKEISVRTGLAINVVTTSTYTLREKGLVSVGCEVLDRVSKRRVTAWITTKGGERG